MEKLVVFSLVFYLVGCIVAFSLLEWLFSRKLSLPLDSKDHFILLLFSLFSWFMVFCLFGIFGFKSFREKLTFYLTRNILLPIVFGLSNKINLLL